ncbi:unnamed protein product [Gongylonema pulchrum]|uniref:S1 motif domain-containing protein n=1 Tax=Gongylonema pulchrum TaxID=637853 RepID=A0A183EI38_9BILA|nr:unnamed protein product [Gongylonema pulchrum]
METGVSEPAVAVLHQDDKPSCAAAAAASEPVSFADQAVISEVVNSVVDSACTDCKDRDCDEEHFADRFKISDPTNFRFFETISQVRPENQAFKSEENVVPPCKTNSSIIEHEYDNLPAIEELSIHVLEDIPLVQFGKVVSIVDRQGKLHSFSFLLNLQCP